MRLLRASSPGAPAQERRGQRRARVVADLSGAALEPGDVLVTAYTDPSWTPAFVTIAGLVTEVGGRMTHGAVVARDATGIISNWQAFGVNGGPDVVELDA